MAIAIGVVVVVVFFVLIFLGSAVRVLREYERGVIFRLGRLIAQKGPGLILLIPIIDRMVRVDLRTVTLNIPPQEVITRDNVPARVNAVAYFRVIDPNKAIVEVENFLLATSQIAQTTLRSVLGKAELDKLLAERERLNEDLQKIIDEQTEPWGVKVSTVEIKDVEIPEQMQRAMARQAEAERERRAKIINAEGEFQAAEKLAQAADIISKNPATLQLRYLQTLLEMGVNQNTTIVFPLPIEMIDAFRRWPRTGQVSAAVRPSSRLSADCRLTVTVRTARDAAEVQAARDLRVRVFCDEQGVDAERGARRARRRGDPDRRARRVRRDRNLPLALSGGGRLQARADGRRRCASAGSGSGASCWPGRGGGARRTGPQTMVLHAQLRAEAFYASYGYVPEGETFMEAEIEHVRMTEGAVMAEEKPKPEIRLDQLTGLRTILSPARADRPVRLRRPARRPRTRQRRSRRLILPLLRGPRGPHPAGDLGGPPGRRAAGHARAGGCARSPTSTRRWLRPRTGRGRSRDEGVTAGRATRCGPPRAGASPTSSRPPSRPASTR